MRGQWIGEFTGTFRGRIMVNIDELSTHFQGVAYLNVADGSLPSIVVGFRTQDKPNKFQTRVHVILPVDPRTGLPSSWEKVKGYFAGGMSFAEWADVDGSIDGGQLSLSWSTNNGTAGSCVLPRSDADRPSELTPLEKGWSTYKQYVATVADRRCIFRGQNCLRRLQTSFHRHGRVDLTRFQAEDVEALLRNLSARTRHVFDLEKGREMGAFLNLAQHHGYPTPLLDWTYSPYVAAFFAYRRIPKRKAAEAGPAEKVRIFVFDQAQWRADFPQMGHLLIARPHLSFAEFIAIENERVVPQQAVSTVTNVVDVEAYIRLLEEASGKTYLWAVDLPLGDRIEATRELSYMGITAGSMFPGLEGTCEELKELNFDE